MGSRTCADLAATLCLCEAPGPQRRLGPCGTEKTEALLPLAALRCPDAPLTLRQAVAEAGHQDAPAQAKLHAS